MESIRKRVAQRLGLLQRIKHLLPQYSRELLVNSLILPLLDYADIVWGDKNNKTLMDNLQVFHNKAAKFVLNLPNIELQSINASQLEASVYQTKDPQMCFCVSRYSVS